MREHAVRAASQFGDRVDFMACQPGSDNGTVTTYRGLATSSVPVTNIAGTCWSYLDIVCRVKDRIEIATLGADKAIWHRAAAESGSWTNWISLGGLFVTPPTITSGVASRVDVFATSSAHTIMHKSKDDAASAWSAWDTLEGHWHSSVGATKRSDGWIDLVALNQGLEMCYKLWNSTNPRGWEVLGGRFKGPPVIAACGTDRVDVFGLDTDNRILHKSGTGTGNSALVWSPAGKEWEDLGGDFDNLPAAISCGPGRMDVFAVKSNGSLRTNTFNNGIWYYGKDWYEMGTGATSAPTVVSRGLGKLDIMAMFANNRVSIRVYAGEQWNEWVPTTAESHTPRTYNGFPPT